MGDVAQILGAKPGSGAGGDEPIFKLRAAAPEKKGGPGKIAVGAGAGQKKKKLSRELSALVGDNVEEVMPPVAPARAMPIYAGLKARPGANRSKRWTWKPFTSSARGDGMQLSHWVRTDAEYPDYPFARFNKKVDIVRYTQQEYDLLLTPQPHVFQAAQQLINKSGNADNASNPSVVADIDVRWPRDHTDLLFDLCKRYDLRWPLIYDRFDARPPHSLEDMKARFYSVTTRVIAHRLRDRTEAVRASVQPLLAYHEYPYRMEWEAKRRKQLDHAFRRLPEHLRLERELLKELKNVQLAIKKANARASAAGAGAIVLSKIPVSALATHAQQERDKARAAAAALLPPSSAAADIAEDEEKEAGKDKGANIEVYPPLNPAGIPLTLHNLTVKRREPYQLGMGSVKPDGSVAMPVPVTVQIPLGYHPSGEPVQNPDGTVPTAPVVLPARDPARDLNPFKGVALRSQQIKAPLEGMQPDSASMKRVAAFLRDQYGCDQDKLLPSVEVLVEHRQLKREADALLQLAATVEQEELRVHKFYALRREMALRPLASTEDDVTAKLKLQQHQLLLEQQQQQQQQQQLQLQQEQMQLQQQQQMAAGARGAARRGGGAGAGGGADAGGAGGGGAVLLQFPEAFPESNYPEARKLALESIFSPAAALPFGNAGSSSAAPAFNPMGPDPTRGALEFILYGLALLEALPTPTALASLSLPAQINAAFVYGIASDCGWDIAANYLPQYGPGVGPSVRQPPPGQPPKNVLPLPPQAEQTDNLRAAGAFYSKLKSKQEVALALQSLYSPSAAVTAAGGAGGGPNPVLQEVIRIRKAWLNHVQRAAAAAAAAARGAVNGKRRAEEAGLPSASDLRR